MSEVVISTDHSSLIIVHHNFSTQNDDGFLAACAAEIDSLLIVHPKIIVYGKECYQHRSVAHFSNDASVSGYKYSGQVAESKPLTPNLTILLSKVNEILEEEFNGILINKYADGTEYISKHSDDEKTLAPNSVIASVSYGASRKFRIRDKSTGEIVKDLRTTSGDDAEIICMRGQFQKEFTHEIVQEKKITEPRYSFTFRKFKS